MHLLLAQVAPDGVTLSWSALWTIIGGAGAMLAAVVVGVMRLGRLLEQFAQIAAQLEGIRGDLRDEGKRREGLGGEVQENTRTLGRHDERIENVEKSVGAVWGELRALRTSSSNRSST